jgi:hypothetical protein
MMPMPTRKFRLAAVAATTFAFLALSTGADAADPCQTAIVKSLAKYKKVYLKSHSKCLDKENKQLIEEGSCPDALADLAVAKANEAARVKIAKVCTLVQIQALGYRSDCAYQPAAQGREAECAAMPVTSTDEFTECMKCRKGAELSEFIATLYASRALQECAGDLSAASTRCSELDCTTPLPVQRVLGDTAENDCQRAIGKAGIKYLLKREKIIEKCLLTGCTRAECLGGTCETALTVPIKLDAAETQKHTVIQNGCGNRDPIATAAGFCCRCGQGNQCMDAADRATCEATPDCLVQEGKVCNLVDLTCDQGPKTITWWENCPESLTGTCPGSPVTTLEGLIDCVDTSADVAVDELICIQFPGYPCPVEVAPTTTTTMAPTTTTVPTTSTTIP